MTHNLFLTGNNAKKNLFSGSKDECVSKIKSMFTDMFIEEDSENPNHFDVFAYEGAMSEVFAIEPKKLLDNVTK